MINTLKQRLKRDESGFTLIELLVVIAIIAILAALILVALNAAQQGARDSKRQSNANQMKTAMANYYSANGDYPTGSNATAICTALQPTYISNCGLLTDPNPSTWYYSGSSSTFTICVRSERDSAKVFAVGPTTSDNKKTGVTSDATCTGVS